MLTQKKSVARFKLWGGVAGSKSIQDLMIALKRSAARFRQVMGPQSQRPLPPPNVTGKSVILLLLLMAPAQSVDHVLTGAQLARGLAATPLFRLELFHYAARYQQALFCTKR